jgi:ABC-type phosphate transport system substrate-binding protein
VTRGARVRAARVVAAVLAVASVLLVSTPAGADGVAVSGGGSSFAQLEMDQWRADTAKQPYNLKVDYAAAGSTLGRIQFANGTFDYGTSDIEYQTQNGEALPKVPFVYVPVSAGGVAFMYNVVGLDGHQIKSIRLSQENICRVFMTPLIYWDDPGIQAENPNVLLPHNLIKKVVRADSSGTSFVFTEFCRATAPSVWATWLKYLNDNNADIDNALRAGLPTSAWPQHLVGQTEAPASDGVANVVASPQSGANAITYDEDGFAVVRGLPVVQVRNAAGVYTSPGNPESVTVALGYAQKRDNGTFALNYSGPDPRAYFPSSYSYVLAQAAGSDPAKGQTLATFLYYATCQGQARAVPLGYARLSSVLVDLSRSKIAQIPGAPAAPPLTACGAPPPPAITPPSATPGGLSSGAAAASKAGSAGPATGTAGGATASAAAGSTGTAESAAGSDQAAAAGGADHATQLITRSEPATPASTPHQSGSEALWVAAVGFGLVALGTLAGGGGRRRRASGGAR